MKISSYNITDVGYHYIGLRVLAGLPQSTTRAEQVSAISKSVLKYAHDKALRLMLPEPKGTFETVGEKICNELVHFEFARSIRGCYEITVGGENVLTLLNERRHIELRRVMASAHLKTYDNLRYMLQKHMEIGSVWRPTVEADQPLTKDYIQRLLKPTFLADASDVAVEVMEECVGLSPGKVEDVLRDRVLRKTLPDITFSEPLFRSLCDRLISLRLLNVMKVSLHGCEFAKSYSPCLLDLSVNGWYVPLKVMLSFGEHYDLSICEPNMGERTTQQKFLEACDKAFSSLSPTAGYYDLPETRDLVCEYIRIPEAAFDEGVNQALDLTPSPLTVGLRYEGISARRKPLSRNRGTTQIYNLIRRA